jgi:hypothetical protein
VTDSIDPVVKNMANAIMKIVDAHSTDHPAVSFVDLERGVPGPSAGNVEDAQFFTMADATEWGRGHLAGKSMLATRLPDPVEFRPARRAASSANGKVLRLPVIETESDLLARERQMPALLARKSVAVAHTKRRLEEQKERRK